MFFVGWLLWLSLWIGEWMYVLGGEGNTCFLTLLLQYLIALGCWFNACVYFLRVVNGGVVLAALIVFISWLLYIVEFGWYSAAFGVGKM